MSGLNHIPKRRILDMVLAMVLVAVGWHQGQATIEAEGLGRFHQDRLEPSVMVACGHGFHAAARLVDGQPVAFPTALEFLDGQRDTFDCSELPAAGSYEPAPAKVYAASHWWMAQTIGQLWAFQGGPAWPGLAPLFGAMYGLTAIGAYAFGRQLLGIGLAAPLAFLLVGSPLLLSNLPDLRDFSKAPFLLLGLAAMLAVVRAPRLGRPQWALAAATGVLAGVGYGFRLDLVILVPLFVGLVGLFGPGGFAPRPLVRRGTAVALFVVGFYLAAMPTGEARGQGRFHVLLLGISEDREANLRLPPTDYQLVPNFHDQQVQELANAHRFMAGVTGPPVRVRTDPYLAATRPLYLDMLAAFPADAVVRAASSLVQLLELPFVDLARWASGTGRELPYHLANSAAEAQAGMALALIAMGTLLARSIRLGLAVTLLMGYFLTVPSLLFEVRHFFHVTVLASVLAAVGLAGIGRLARGLWADARRTRLGERPWAGLDRNSLPRIAVPVLGPLVLVAAIAGTIEAARYAQNHLVHALVERLEAAPTEPIGLRSVPWAGGGVAMLYGEHWLGPPRPSRAEVEPDRTTEREGYAMDYLVVHLERRRCLGIPSPIGLQYHRHVKYLRGAVLDPEQLRNWGGNEEVRIYVPALRPARTLEAMRMSMRWRECVQSVERLVDPQAFDLPLRIAVPDDWRGRDYQQAMAPPLASAVPDWE